MWSQGLRRGHWSEVKYRGDPLRRPIASYEVPVLARLAVRASCAANARLGLYSPVRSDEEPPAHLLQVPGTSPDLVPGVTWQVHAEQSVNTAPSTKDTAGDAHICSHVRACLGPPVRPAHLSQVLCTAIFPLCVASVHDKPSVAESSLKVAPPRLRAHQNWCVA